MKVHAAALAAIVVFLRWLAVGHVTATVSGLTFTMPALAVAAVAVTAVSGAAVALVIYRLRADQVRRATWRAARAGGGG
jgi:hypothetical protein